MKKLLIIGTAGNRAQAPYDDLSFDVWATGGNANVTDVKRIDALFELHPERQWKRLEVLEILRKHSAKIYMQDHYDEIPNSVRYPIETVKETFYIPTMGNSLYVTNTVSFMFALAYLEGYEHIETYGVYMEHETEYVHQRLNCEYYVGWLAAKGIDVTIHGGEILKSAFVYAYEEPDQWIKLLEDGAGLEQGKKDLEKQLEAKQRELWMQAGAIQYNKDLRQRFGGY